MNNLPATTKGKPSGSPNYGKINKEEAFLMACQGKTVTNIANYFGVNPSAVSRILKPYKARVEAHIAFVNNKDTVFEEKQGLLLNEVNAKTVKRLHPAQAITGVAILEDKIRAIRGQATGFMVNVHADLEAIKALRHGTTKDT